MKKFFYFCLFVVIFILPVVSCQKEDIDLSGVDTSGNLPSPLSKNTNWCWVTEENFNKTYDEVGNGCNSYYDSWSETTRYYDCGMWRTVDFPIYYGTVEGIRYIAPNLTTFVMSEDTYLKGLDLVTRFKTIKAYFDRGENPVGQNFMRIESFEQL